MEIQKLSASVRNESGKSASYRLRRSGQIPAIAYGKGLPATRVAVAPKALRQVLSTEHGQNAVIELGVESGPTLTVMVRDFAIHPISRELTHADFFEVKLDQPVDVEVPLRASGKPKGVVMGGILQQIFRRLPIRCLPRQIPAFIEVDVSEIDLGESLKANQIKLAEGVKIRLPEEQTVFTVNAPEKGGEEEKAAPGAPAAAAPAAAGKAAAGKAAPAAAAPAKAAPAKDKKK